MDTKTKHSMFVEYTFFSVGQGLFFCGKIHICDHKPFVWVYDCGSANAKDKLSSSIDELQEIDEFDLVAISHFDDDHINGLPYLLAQKKVKKLVIPFLTAEQKTLELINYCAECCNEDDTYSKLTDDSLEFLKNPGAYITKISKQQSVVEILYVPDKSYVLNNNDIRSNEQNDLSYRYTEKKEDGIIKKILDPNSPMIYKTWEFLFYNDITEYKKLNKKNFPYHWNDIEKNVKKLLDNVNEHTKTQALNDLKTKHDTLIAPVKRNPSSLFLYAGCCDYELATKCYSFQDGKIMQKHGILFTGDGVLSNLVQLNDLLTYLGGERRNNIYCLQVMHHGSKYNSCSEVAKLLHPSQSVFSADPQYKYNHPHGCVVLDFIYNAPILTTKNIYHSFAFFDCCSCLFRKKCLHLLCLKFPFARQIFLPIHQLVNLLVTMTERQR